MLKLRQYGPIFMTALILLVVGCSPLSRGHGARVVNTEMVFVSFGANQGEVAPCG
ncbi:MAG: hypothetical protein KJ970_02030 [Candidatus Eisenbacteria bacterium]|uniref:Lipoprotein n=1 Tax=Eiseniibacteriota bacterium TaxID=2212470 RepID=A0A948RRJ2_UNCEI|nr:hypothetical protein [Candidatus Eisenbacteria bacterium]MBU1948212.1 hypothetical protein [Candidatus Eisenbacteria bacterium]MBU2689675.1 hypothetical protein [Candidatus Eisenbacteria bacterium]